MQRTTSVPAYGTGARCIAVDRASFHHMSLYSQQRSISCTQDQASDCPPPHPVLSHGSDLVWAHTESIPCPAFRERSTTFLPSILLPPPGSDLPPAALVTTLSRCTQAKAASSETPRGVGGPETARGSWCCCCCPECRHAAPSTATASAKCKRSW